MAESDLPKKNQENLLPRLDPDQAKAIKDLTSPMAFVAGAGSGKTRVLVERYVEIISRGLATVSEIAAITYTNKAAREMKVRVRDRLSGMLVTGDAGIDVDNVRSALEMLETARISTIHSFCSAILRENTIEAGIDPEFRVLDDAEHRLLRNEAIESHIRKILASKDEATRELVGYFRYNGLLGIANSALQNRYSLPGAVGKSL